MTATVVFVRATHGHYHRTWIERSGLETLGLRLHVLHDLPHLVVESALGLDDGLWGALAETGVYPGLTDGHLVAKAFTNAVVNRWQLGPDDPAGVRERLRLDEAGRPNDRVGFDPVAHGRFRDRLRDHLGRVEDRVLEAAIGDVRTAYTLWDAVAVGDALRLPWPIRAGLLRQYERTEDADRGHPR